MRYQLFAVLGLFLVLAMLCAEFLWLYLLADKQDREEKEKEQKIENCNVMIDAILHAPTQSAKRAEEQQLASAAQEDNEYMNIVTNLFIERVEGFENYTPTLQRAIREAVAAINPIPYYSKMLDENDDVKKSYACQRLSALGAVDNAEKIRSFLDDRNRNLRYAAGFSLAGLGDIEGVFNFLIDIQGDKKYSSRIINEAIDRFSGDRYELAEKLIEGGDAYMRATVIKSVGKYHDKRLLPYILECVNDNDVNIKIAATKALGYYDDKDNILTIIRLSKDQNWVVREFAVKALANFSTAEAVKAVEAATQDPQWWVRQSAEIRLLQWINRSNTLKMLLRAMINMRARRLSIRFIKYWR